MATRYVRTNGADGTGGHDGTTPALAWLTLGYAMGQVSAGDTIWVGAGTYRVSSTIAPSSMASMTYCYGDTDGSQTGDAGQVIVTNYSTNDTTAPSAVPVFTFASKNYWTLGRMTIVDGHTTATDAAVKITGGSHDLTFADLTIWSHTRGFYATSLTFGVTMNVTFERCRIRSTYANEFDMPQSASGAHTDAVVLIRNCVFTGGYFALVQYATSNNTYKTGGITLINCTFLCYGAVYAYQTYESTTYPIRVYNCLVATTDYAFNSLTSGAIVEDYNVVGGCQYVYTNTSAGANTISNNARLTLVSQGHEGSYGAIVRSYGEPVAGSPLLGWGGSGTYYVTDDITGVTRPASGAGSVGKALGAFERANSGTRETSTVRSGANALKITGPGYHDFALPVAAQSTTVTVYGRYDGTYTGTLPSMSVRNAGEAGVADATDTMAGGANSWEQLSLTFTPTAAGIVTIRLLSSDTNGGGAAYWDDFSVT